MDEPVPGYPKRPVPRDAAAARELTARTLTNLYNIRPQWLADDLEALLSVPFPDRGDDQVIGLGPEMMNELMSLHGAELEQIAIEQGS